MAGPLRRRRARWAQPLAPPPPTTAHGRAARPHHRRPYRDHRCRAALVPADERQFRPVSAAAPVPPTKKPTARGCAATKRRSPRNRRSARARWRTSTAGSPSTARRGGGMSGLHDHAQSMTPQCCPRAGRRRAAQARRVFDHRARPLRPPSRRSRCGAAPDRPGAVVVASAGAASVRGASAARWRWRGDSASRPRLLCRGRQALVRGFIDGVALHIAGPQGDVAYFRSAKRRCASCIAPASATTILPRSRTGCAAPTAAPTSPTSSSPPASRGAARLFRIAAYEDLRHLLKHKRTYAPDALTPTRAQASWRARAGRRRIWLMTGKKVYQRDHARPVQFHRPRRRRAAAGQRRARAGRAAPDESAGARCRDCGLRGPPHRHRALRLCRGRRAGWKRSC